MTDAVINIETNYFHEGESTTTVASEEICVINKYGERGLIWRDVTIAIDKELDVHFDQLANIVINMGKEYLFEENVTISLVDEEIFETINLSLLMETLYITLEDPYYPIASSSSYNIFPN